MTAEEFPFHVHLTAEDRQILSENLDADGNFLPMRPEIRQTLDEIRELQERRRIERSKLAALVVVAPVEPVDTLAARFKRWFVAQANRFLLRRNEPKERTTKILLFEPSKPVAMPASETYGRGARFDMPMTISGTGFVVGDSRIEHNKRLADGANEQRRRISKAEKEAVDNAVALQELRSRVKQLSPLSPLTWGVSEFHPEGYLTNQTIPKRAPEPTDVEAYKPVRGWVKRTPDGEPEPTSNIGYALSLGYVPCDPPAPKPSSARAKEKRTAATFSGGAGSHRPKSMR